MHLSEEHATGHLPTRSRGREPRQRNSAIHFKSESDISLHVVEYHTLCTKLIYVNHVRADSATWQAELTVCLSLLACRTHLKIKIWQVGAQGNSPLWVTIVWLTLLVLYLPVASTSTALFAYKYHINITCLYYMCHANTTCLSHQHYLPILHQYNHTSALLAYNTSVLPKSKE